MFFYSPFLYVFSKMNLVAQVLAEDKLHFRNTSYSHE